jgi:hypothetical protein
VFLAGEQAIDVIALTDGGDEPPVSSPLPPTLRSVTKLEIY